MAKKTKDAGKGIPPAMRKPLLALGALVGLLLGTMLLWQGFQSWRQTRIEPQLLQLRTQLAGDISAQVAALRERLASIVDNAYVQADLAAGARDDAAKRIREAWPELAAVEFFEPSLDEAFASDLQQFGFAKLALLSAAHANGKSVGEVVGAGDAAALGLAAPVHQGEEMLAIVFVSLPLDALTEPVTRATLPGGYLELRTGQRVLASSGDALVKPNVSLTDVEDVALQVGSAPPRLDTLLAYPPMVQIGLGIFALLAAGGLIWSFRRTDAFAVGSDEPELTFEEVLQHAPVESAAATRATRARPPVAQVDRSIFRAYDIRGVVGQTLDEGVARLIGQAIGTLMAEKSQKEIVVGRDGRLSGPSMSAALIEGLRRAGRDVIDIGIAPTPVVYFGTFQLGTSCGVAVTGSHNPPDYNGFKIVVAGETLSGDAIQDLYARIADNRLDSGGSGGLQLMDISHEYLARIAGDIQLERKLKVVLDAGNGVAGNIAPQVLEAIGAEVVPLYCEVDGEFPNHHPDPGDPHNLQDLITFVDKLGADLGIAFDGDGDRLGVVTRHGEIIYPDRLLMLFAQDVLSRNPGATVIYDVKCTGHLAGQILRHGGSPIMWKTGHSLIKAKMRETEAELAGEMSGHFFFRERWYGFDDGIYSAARLLEILAADERSPEEILGELPKGVSTPELKIPMAEGEHYAYMDRFREHARFEGAKIATIDGVRADWPDGWGLVRCSNTTPCLVLRFDADNADALHRIQDAFRVQLKLPAITQGAELELPF
jgi:phosphomannomutase/phosphoglucomutase